MNEKGSDIGHVVCRFKDFVHLADQKRQTVEVLGSLRDHGESVYPYCRLARLMVLRRLPEPLTHLT